MGQGGAIEFSAPARYQTGMSTAADSITVSRRDGAPSNWGVCVSRQISKLVE
jgi:hypothetical protein